MAQCKLSARLRLQIEVALDQDCTCHWKIASQDQRAGQLGLTRAEIDSARARRGFDVQTAAAIDFACAIASHDPVRIHVAAVNALASGISKTQLEQIAAIPLSSGEVA